MTKGVSSAFVGPGSSGTACAAGAATAATANARAIRLSIQFLLPFRIFLSSLVGRLRCLLDAGGGPLLPCGSRGGDHDGGADLHPPEQPLRMGHVHPNATVRTGVTDGSGIGRSVNAD